MNEIQIIGGARIGLSNITFPFAKLIINKNKLELKASILGNAIFQPSDIRSIEPYTSFPLIGQGIRINHSVAQYNKKIIFWTFKNPHTIIKQIKESNFLTNTNLSEKERNKIITKQQSGIFPLKKSFGIGVIIVWNLLFLSDFFALFHQKTFSFFGKGNLIAIGLLFSIALLSLISEKFSKLILKDGKKIEDIKGFAVFVLIISSLILFTRISIFPL